jgi:hypothetical protein
MGKELALRIDEAGSGGGSIVTVTEDENYVNVNIIDNTPVLSVSAESIVMGGDTKTATFKVSGLRLRGDINIGVSGTGFTVNKESISPVDGTVAETTVTVTYGGSASASGSISVSSAGAVPASISLTYTEQQVPTIIVDDSAISFKAGGGATNQQTLTVQGVNLTAGITAAIGGTNAGKFSVSPASISQSGGTASGTLTVTYSPAAADSGTHTATLTLSSSGATSKVITLNGAVSSLTVSKQSMTFSTDQGVAVTDTFTVEGTNLNSDITIAASGTGFSVSPNTIAQSGGTVASTTVTVTYSPSAAGTNTGSITIQSSGVTKTISLSGTAEAAAVSDDEGKFTKKDANGNTLYLKRGISDGQKTLNVTVYNSTYDSEYGNNPVSGYSGDIVIPATVTVDGVECTIKSISTNCFNRATMTSISLPNTITSIGIYSFRRCNSLTSLTIPDSVTSLGLSFVNDCSNLETLILGSGASEIPNYTGSTCPKLSTVVIPEGVTKINQYCFGSTFTSIDMPSTLSTIGGNTKFCVNSSSTVTIRRSTPPSVSGFTFVVSSSSTDTTEATLKVPSAAVSTYQGASFWGTANSSGYKMFNPNNIVAITE